MNIITHLKFFLNKSYLYRKLAYLYQKISVGINPKAEINRNYVLRFGQKPDLEHPHNLIEKIYWMQLHCDTSIWSLCADKYRMREYVKSRGFERYLPKLYGVWEDPSNIIWDDLPNQFVIKTNNGCASVIIVDDKLTLDKRNAQKQLKQWLAIPYGYRGYQPHYLSIKPCIIAEELLIQDRELTLLSKSMVDFKVWCFNGKPESIFVAYNRNKNLLNVDLYDTNWNRLRHCLRNHGIDKVNDDVVFSKPECLEEMLMIASKLSMGHPQMRVDFYIVNAKPVIGELTMATGYGYFTEDYYNHLGDLTDISLMRIIK